jgi:hypothetical protein
MKISPCAGKPAEASMLVKVRRLISQAICLWRAESRAMVNDSLAATPDRSDKS